MNVVNSMQLVASTVKACAALGVPRATYYRAMMPTAPTAKKPVSHPSSVTDAEKLLILGELTSERFCDVAVPEIYAALLDEGRYLCSMSTMYRLLHGANMLHERRPVVSRAHYPRPELLATAPNQVWSWDITKLKGPAKWNYFYLYVIMDIFSRFVVGWMVARREQGCLARSFIEECCARQGVKRDQLILHSDRGSPMKSKPVAFLLSDLGITKSHSRPHVSNDNPFSESNFKTLKYRPDFPERFGSLEHSRSFCGDFFPWYNDDHHHSGIAMLTPSDLHYGRGAARLAARHEIMMAAFLENPQRFNGRPPKLTELPTEVWINKPILGEAIVAS